MVTELRDLGAVLFCKTSVPHTLMAGETMNNIIEYTWNPKNRYLACGGSSGGEGALLGLKGSPVGLGTDIGGYVSFSYFPLYFISSLLHKNTHHSIPSVYTLPQFILPLW
jgi:hypothetical protein